MAPLRPKFITFDCYGTLTRMLFPEMAREIYGSRLKPGQIDQFIRDFSGYRFDEVQGPWKPYRDVIVNAAARTCRRHGIRFFEAEAQAFYDAVPRFAPHPDVPAALKIVAKEFPLVGLTNAMDVQIMHNVAMYEAPFHRVITAEQVQSYKPRFKGFEAMMDMIGAKPEELLHVSSSFRYDLMSAYDLGIKMKAWVNRGHEPPNPFYEYHEIADIGGLPGLLGL
jgi:2-haloacid dehalogenase